MNYRVDELGNAAGLPVDTIRFYQGKGLIEPPRRQGRVVYYSERHLERLRQIRSLLEQGFSLAQIGRMADRGTLEAAAAGAAEAALVDALVSHGEDERTFTRAELAVESGVAEPLIQAAVSAGLVEPLRVAGEERFSGADLEMARSALAMLGAGLPLGELLQLAVTHAANVRETTEQAIDLFDAHVRKAQGNGEHPERITETFRLLLPAVTRLVALHFQRTLVNRALDRLQDDAAADREALREALAATESARLEVAWR